MPDKTLICTTFVTLLSLRLGGLFFDWSFIVQHSNHRNAKIDRPVLAGFVQWIEH